MQTYLPRGGKSIERRGTWDTRNQGTDQFQLVLNDALMVPDEDSPMPSTAIPKGLYTLWPTKIRGSIWLDVDADGWPAYERVP